MLRFIVSAAALALASLASAQPLTTAFTFQGELNSAGSPVTGTYDVRFTLYDALSGGAQQGSTLCSDNVAIAGGRFTVQLDFGAQFAGAQRFVEVQVRQDTGLSCANTTGYTTLAPRQSLTAAPNAVYALNAATATTSTNATQLNGQSPSFYTNAANLTGTLPDARLSTNVPRLNAANSFAGNMGIGGAALPNRRLAVTGGLDVFDSLAQGISLTSDNIRFSNADSEDPVYQYTLIPESHQFFIGGGAMMTLSSTGVSATAFSGNGAGLTNVNASLLNGLSSTAFLQSVPSPLALTAAPNGGAVIRATNTGTGVAVMGVWGEITSTSATGSSYGGYFTNVDDQGYGVYGRAQGVSGHAVSGDSLAATGANYGGYFTCASPAGAGVFGIGPARGGLFQASQSNSVALEGHHTGATGSNSGVHGVADSSNGFGVFGETTSTSGNLTWGVYGKSAGGTGVFGQADATALVGVGVGGEALATTGVCWGGSFDSSSTSGVGVKGYASATTGSTYGVYGDVNSSSGFAVYAHGNMGASGTKSFRIDDPTDPENKYLLHYCIESPEVLNAYTGKVTLNQQGEATIDLPPYFAAINKDPRYTLTAIGAPMPLLHIAEEISDDALAQGATIEPGQPVPATFFRIAGGAPNAKVSWEVKALRNDRWVQQHGAPVSVDKQDLEKGTYQHPGLYNQPREKGLNDQETPLRTPGAAAHPTPSHT